MSAFLTTALLFAGALSGGAPADLYGDPLPAHARARLGTTRFRQAGKVISVAYSPDGKVLASGGWDNLVHLWDAESGKELRQCQGHTDAVWPVLFSPDGKLLASSGREGVVRLWDPANGKPVRVLQGHTAGVYKIAFTSDSKRLVSGGMDGSVRVWDVADGTVVKQFRPGNEIHGLALSPDEKLLAAGNNLGDVFLWDLAAGTEAGRIPHAHTSGIDALAFTPDGKVLASGGWDHTVGLWEVPSGKEIRRLTGPADNVWPVTFSPDGKTLAGAGRDGIIRLWDWQKGDIVRTLEGHHGGVPRVTFSPDGKRLASASWDGTIRVWDPATGKEVGPAGGHAGEVTGVAFLADGAHLATAGADGTVRYWDAVGKALSEASKPSLSNSRLALSGDGTTAVIAGEFGGTWVRENKTGKSICAFTGRAAPTGVCMSQNGALAAVSNSDSTIYVYDAASGLEVHRIELRPVTGVPAALPTFSWDAAQIAAVRYGRFVILWDTASGKQIQQFDVGASVEQVAFAPDGRSVAAASEGKAIVWETLTGKERRRLEGQAVQTLAFSPDGRLLALGGRDGSISFWDQATGKSRGRYPGHAGPVTAVAFSADGKSVASGGADSTTLVWDLDGLDAPQEPPAGVMEGLWAALGDDDGGKAFDAVWRLAAAPKQAVPYLRERVRPAAATDAAGMAKLIARLDDDDFDVREQATHDLTDLGPAAEPFLRDALAKGPSAEVKVRIGRILADLGRSTVTPNGRRTRRAVEALEHMDAPEARELLQALAKGGADSLLTQDAKAALARLERRAAP